MAKKTMALIIVDGWGHRTESNYNPTITAITPTIDNLLSNYPHVFIEASGAAVGLPDDQMGNSEVGHLHIGAGRKVPQELTRIQHDIKTGAFFENPILKNAIQTAKKNDAAIHVIGLVSDGGVHSHIDHLCAIINMIHQHGVLKNYCHVICDGRDTPPQSALSYVERIEKVYADFKTGGIASVIGRYYAMDRDQRWDRTEKAYDLLTQGKSDFVENTAQDAIKAAYARGESDEFILPTLIVNAHQKPITLQNNDVIIFMNFRADRAKQLTNALLDPHFSHFKRHKKILPSYFVSLTEHVNHCTAHCAYSPLTINNTLGEFLSHKGLTQLRLAETEKYAHVTYFLNGGVEAPYHQEFRELIPSPHVATYDLQPEMSATALTDAFVAAIESQRFDVIICNYANPDMVGHTGCIPAAEKAMEVIDACLKRVLDALKKEGGEALITADHGNIEMMYDEKTGQPHTAHTTNTVPLIYVGRPAKPLSQTGALDDVAPTLLHVMGLTKPPEMTGNNLFDVGLSCE